ncbi:MAG: TIM23 complex component [Vezdaea acicularis]|nr:MAG: TIM23 complex component [Vezdaea acicularis]
MLDWNTYFKLRKSRRRYNLAASLGTSVCSTALGVSILSRPELDAVGHATLMGMEPFIVLGIVTAGFGALGWLLGPSLGSTAFGLLHKNERAAMDIKEKDFFNRIKRYRVDPSQSTLSSPLPDFYGEKVGSVAGYRQWLKDQRAYSKKRASLV